MAAQRIPFNLGTSSYQSQTIPFSAQRCVNLFLKTAQEPSWSGFELKTISGIVEFGTAGAEPNRGMEVMKGVLYVVNDKALFSVDEFGSATLLGVVDGEERVIMAHNGTKLCVVVPGGKGYVYDAGTLTFTEITDPDYRTADSVCFKDGYYIFTETGTNVFFNSALNDPLTFDPLDFGTSELSPEGLVGCHVENDELYLFGQNNTEVFQNIGGSGFPFQRIPGASFEKGLASRYGVTQWDKGIYFIGFGRNEKPSFWRIRGSGEVFKISTDAIDSELQKFAESEIAQSFVFTYSLNGYNFIGWTIRSVNITSRTFVFNTTASQHLGKRIWHEQQSGVFDGAWRVQDVVKVYSKIIVSDNIDGRLGYLDSVYTEYGEPFIRERITSPTAGDGSSLFLSELELTVDAGRGLLTGQGSDPFIEMDYSIDGARTWSPRFIRSMGKTGEYNKRVVWRRLGRIPAVVVFRFRVSDPIDVSFIKLEAKASAGR